MLKTILILLGLVAAGAAAVVAYAAATQPSEFHITRAEFINAPPNKIQPLVNDFKAWGAWSPWEQKDPGMMRSYSEPSAGQGARYAWDGNQEVGSGEMVMAESSPEKIKLDMHFKSPMEARHTAEFTFVPEGGGTKVSWSMFGSASLMSKVMCVFFDMDKMVGGEFEKGLAAMKSKAEG
jgi:hypothetical protein